MIVLECQGCGQKGEIPEGLADELDKCPRCGQELSEAAGATTLGPRDEHQARPLPRRSVARRWKRYGMVLGGLAGAAAVPLLAAVGGPVAPPVLGALGGGMVGALFGAELASLAGFKAADFDKNLSWVDLAIVFLTVLGIAVGIYFGALLKELPQDVLLAATGGALLGGGLLGALCGERLGKKADQRATAEAS